MDIRKDADVTTYEIRVTDPYGLVIRVVDEFTSIDYARKINEVGQLALTIEDNGSQNVFLPENRVEVWRSNGAVLRLDMDATWFIHSVKHRFDGSSVRYFDVEAHCPIGLLERRFIPYNEGNPTTEKQAPGDDVMKAIMRENFGALAADVDRDLSAYLTIQGDSSLAQQVTVFCAKENIYDVIKDIADTSNERGTFLAFDVIYNPNAGTFEFRTYIGQRGVDRSVSTGDGSSTVGVDRGSLASASYFDSRIDEKNIVTAGAKDLVGIVPPQTVEDVSSIGLSPFHRKEFFVNASSADDDIELLDEANAAFQENKYRATFEGELSQEYALNEYGEKFAYGDKVTVSFDGREYTCMVDAINVNVSTSGEKISVLLKGTND
jgi:hypothetical protein